ncbi:MAG: alpha/beta hydrolase [Zoogloeaceae bacterium]|nr:alpha/beta hydrolase [Zoogloeaceae bacterium]
MKPFESHFHELRGIRAHVREWGRRGAPMLVMLHGWSDVSATFQFVIDAFEHDWHVVAPDWRGHGLTGRGDDAYWFANYMGDLDALLRLYSPGAPVRMVGHSMGGNVAHIYAGVRPGRVSALVTLESLARPDRPADEAPQRYATWLDQLATRKAPRTYEDVEALAVRLRRANHRLTEARALFMARHYTEADEAGGVRIAVEPAHRNVHPVMHRRAEAEACWRNITAPVLWLMQEGTHWREIRGIDEAAWEHTRRCFAKLRETPIADCGHNMQHDQPERVAAAIEAFLAEVAPYHAG